MVSPDPLVLTSQILSFRGRDGHLALAAWLRRTEPAAEIDAIVDLTG